MSLVHTTHCPLSDGFLASPPCSSAFSSFDTCEDRGPDVKENAWGPYIDNGGTAVSVSGPDYAVVVADTRLSLGYSIHTRSFSKLTQLTSKCVIASCGMQAEIVTLHKLLKIRMSLYEHAHRRPPSVRAVAQLLSTVLYQKRFFPFYTFNLIAGIDGEGKGVVFGYDAIGSHEELRYVATGTGGALITSILDNQIAKHNQQKPDDELTKEGVIDLVKDVINSAAERDIFTGDSADVMVLDASGIHHSVMQLRKD